MKSKKKGTIVSIPWSIHFCEKREKDGISTKYMTVINVVSKGKKKKLHQFHSTLGSAMNEVGI